MSASALFDGKSFQLRLLNWL